MIQTKYIDYKDGSTALEGFYAADETLTTIRPAILVVHDWSGRNEFSCQKAEQLAQLGYIGFAIDMFGKGVLGRNNDEKMALISPFLNDRGLLTLRILSAYHALKKLEYVDTSRIAAIGYCFGGLCVLDLARSNADVCGVVSFHGLLNAPSERQQTPIKAKVLAFQGHDDPMVPPEQVLAFENEMTAAQVDWQVTTYGNTTHGFTNPLANDNKLGTLYNPVAAERAWLGMKIFFEEILAISS